MSRAKMTGYGKTGLVYITEKTVMGVEKPDVVGGTGMTGTTLNTGSPATSSPSGLTSITTTEKHSMLQKATRSRAHACQDN